MDNRHETRLVPSTATHPGDSIGEYLDFYGWSQADLAERTDLPIDEIEAICSGGARISRRAAEALATAFKRPAHLWLNLQLQFDEAVARRDRESPKTPLSEWAKQFPLKEMRKLRFSVPKGLPDSDALLKFFGVTSLESWASEWSELNVAYRQTRNCSIHQPAVVAWIREAEIIAETIKTQQFDDSRVQDSIETIRGLTREPVETIMDPLQTICAQCGISVVLVPALSRTGISGCACWISNSKAMIGLTLRYRTDDQLWFTFFHELGHILLHNNRHPFVIDNTDSDLFDECIDPSMMQCEAEANRFSSNTLIPKNQFNKFRQEGVFTNDSIHEFAERINIGPSIVVGRLQFERILQHHQGNRLKQRINWKFNTEE